MSADDRARRCLAAPVTVRATRPGSTYERELRDYVRRGQGLAKGNAIRLIPRSRHQIRMRSLFIRMLPYMPWRGLVAGGVHKAANAITLTDCPVLTDPQSRSLATST